MATYEATVTSKGQVTLPVRLRSDMGLKAGDKLVFRTDEHGRVEIEARTGTFEALRGMIKTDQKLDSETVSRWIEDARGARWRAFREQS